MKYLFLQDLRWVKLVLLFATVLLMAYAVVQAKI